MKRTFYIAGIAFITLLASCEQKQVADNSLEGLIAKRDSIKLKFDKLNAELKELDKKIDDLDSTKKLYIVNSITAEVKEFKDYIEVQGNVNSDQNITMYPELAGSIKKVLVKEGDRVKKGQILIKFENDVLVNSRKELSESLKLAETTYQKQKALWEQNIGSEMQYLTAKSTVESLKSKLAALNSQIQMSQLTAHFDGVVDQIFVKEGEMGNPALPALRLINLDKMFVEADVSERYMSVVSKGTEVIVDFENLDKEVVTQIDMIGNFINPANRSFRIVSHIENSDRKLKPNQIAVLRLNSHKSTGIVVPNRVILNSPDGSSYVYVLSTEDQDFVVSKRTVEVGMSYRGESLVLSCLNQGDVIVDKGSRSVQDGQKVRVKQ